MLSYRFLNHLSQKGKVQNLDINAPLDPRWAFFKSGTTTASFRPSGKTPVSKDSLMMSLSWETLRKKVTTRNLGTTGTTQTKTK